MYSSKNDQETYTKQIQKTNKQAKTKAGSMERHFQKTLTDNKNTATPNSSFNPLDAWKGEFKKSFFPCVLLGDFEKKWRLVLVIPKEGHGGHVHQKERTLRGNHIKP